MRKLLILLLLPLACLGQFRTAQQAKKYGKNVAALNQCNVYSFIGDSNLKGAAPDPTPVPTNYQGPHGNTLIYAKNNQTSTDNGAFAAPVHGTNDAPGYSTPYGDAYGSTMALSYQLGNLMKKKVAIIKLGIAGSALVTHPSGASLSWHSTSGNLWGIYRDYFATVALPKLTTAGYRYTVKGAIVRLGTNDVLVNTWDLTTFKAQVQILVANIRTLAGNSSLPIYWYLVRSDIQDRPNPYSDPPAGSVAAIRQAIIDCTTVGNGAYIANFYTIDPDGSSGDVISDGTHFTPTVYDLQGLTEANLMYTIGE